MTGFNEYVAALSARDAISSLLQSELDLKRPAYRYAKVTGIDRLNRKCTVKFEGDAADITVSMGSIQPKNIDQIVRISGYAGDKFIDDVMGEAYTWETPRIDTMGGNLWGMGIRVGALENKALKVLGRWGNGVFPSSDVPNNNAWYRVYTYGTTVIPENAELAVAVSFVSARATANAAMHWKQVGQIDSLVGVPGCENTYVHNNTDQYIPANQSLIGLYDVAGWAGSDFNLWVDGSCESGSGSGFTTKPGSSHITFIGNA